MSLAFEQAHEALKRAEEEVIRTRQEYYRLAYEALDVPPEKHVIVARLRDEAHAIAEEACYRLQVRVLDDAREEREQKMLGGRS